MHVSIFIGIKYLRIGVFVFFPVKNGKFAKYPKKANSSPQLLGLPPGAFTSAAKRVRNAPGSARDTACLSPGEIAGGRKCL